MYVQKIEGEAWREGKLDKAKLDKMSGRLRFGFHRDLADIPLDEQIVQLYELMQAIKTQGEEEEISGALPQ
jgi:hypothetical protein